MTLSPSICKARALRAIRGNWQTALLVSFFATLLYTIADLVNSLGLSNLSGEVLSHTTSILATLGDPNATQEALAVALQAAEASALQAYLLAALGRVPTLTWVLLGVTQVLSLLLTPVLSLGCDHYFLSRLRGTELGFKGLFSRMQYWGKALLLSLLVAVKVLLWSLLFVVPGIIASIRYSMATYYLAEDPTISAWQAIEKSKRAMQNSKMSYFMLMLSFAGWMLLSILLQMLLSDVGGAVLSMVVGQCANLVIATYMNGAYAAFYLTIAHPEETEPAGQAPSWMNGGEGSWPPEDNGDEDTPEEDRPKPSDYYPPKKECLCHP